MVGNTVPAWYRVTFAPGSITIVPIPEAVALTVDSLVIRVQVTARVVAEVVVRATSEEDAHRRAASALLRMAAIIPEILHG